MALNFCDSLEATIRSHLSSLTFTKNLREMCLVTLPLVTADGRFTDIYIEPQIGGYFLVTDAGKTAGELILSGAKITDSLNRQFRLLAEGYGLVWKDESFSAPCKADLIPQTVLAVATCATIASLHSVGRSVLTDQDDIKHLVGTTLKRWGKGRARIVEDDEVQGRLKQHVFDFVVRPQSGSMQPVAVTILNPSSGGALSITERYAFKIQDLKNTEFGAWRNIAVATKADKWTKDADALLVKCADLVVVLDSTVLKYGPSMVEAMDKLIAA